MTRLGKYRRFGSRRLPIAWVTDARICPPEQSLDRVGHRLTEAETERALEDGDTDAGRLHNRVFLTSRESDLPRRSPYLYSRATGGCATPTLARVYPIHEK